MGNSRTIDTVIRLQNESEYKTALKNCSAELKTLKSELDKVTSQYRTNANSMEALSAKGDTLSKMYAAQSQKVDILKDALEKSREAQKSEAETVASLREQYDQAKDTLKSYAEEFGENSEEYANQKAKVDELRDAVIAHEAKLESSTKSVNSYTVQLNRADVELDRLADQQAENNRLLDEAKKSADGCAVSIDRYGDAAKQAADGTGQSVSAVDALSSAMVASGIQQKVSELAATMMECSTAAQEYELSLAQVSTIADESVLSSQAMRDGIMQISTDLRKDANEVADAVYNALSAGVDTADVLNFVSQSSQLATAGFTEMGASVDVLTTILNAYRLKGKETESIASKLVMTQNLGKITVDQLGSVLGRIIPSAAAYGVNLDNIAAAYANMTASGINAENTTTYLAAMLDELADSGSAVSAVLRDRTGKSFAELMSAGSSLGDVLAILGDSVANDNTQFANLWSSATAGKAAISLFSGGAEAFNATLDQMANSSGTVAKNYEKMTSVSDYASQRLTVASKNIKIAIGDQLNPVLDKLRNAGAGILEKATEVIAKSPALVSMITGIVTALGLLATGLSALMIAKAVAAAMTALNIAMAANPAVLIATAIAGLVAALATYAAQIETTEDRIAKLTVSAQALNETISDSATSYDDSIASVDAAANTVGMYISQLEWLEKQGLETNAQQIEYQMILDKINEIMPGINAELDLQTNLVKGGTESLRAQAAAWSENARAEAIYARYKDDMAAVADAEYEVAKNQALLSMRQREAARLTAQYNGVQRTLSMNLAAQQRIINDSSMTYEESAAAMDQLKMQEAEMRQEISDLTVEIGQNEIQQRNLNAAIDEGNQSIANAQDEVDAATAAYDAMSASAQNAATGVGESSAAMADGVSASTKQMTEAYAALYASARTSLDNQIGLFDDLSGKCDMSTQDMIDNLLSQQTAFNNYAANLTSAIAMGIDIGLVQKLSDGSVESMQILDEIVNDSNLSVDEINAAFEGMSAAKDTAAAAMADVQTAVNDGMDDIADDLYADGTTAGGYLGDGLIAGINGKIASYELAVSNLANSGVQAYSRVNMINSPSKRYAKLAHWDVEGAIVQYKTETPRLENAASDMADAGYSAAVNARRAALPSIVAAVPSMQRTADARSYDLLRQILAAIKSGKQIVLDSGALVGGTVDQFDAEMGYRKMLADRGAV